MHIYFSGLGGVAIGPLALICRDAGYQISGSDMERTRWTKLMELRGVHVEIGQDGSHIAHMHAQRPIDWLVITAAVPDNHPEVIFAREHGIKITKRADMLNLIIARHRLKLVAISGTHGKTTTTSMIVWLCMQNNIPVSYSIGSNVRFGPNGKYQPGSEYFVYEADEFDRNMLQFHPYMGVITSIDYDHPDVYKDQKDYDQAFQQFAAQSNRVIAWRSDAARAHLEHAAMVTLPDNGSHLDAIKLAGLHNRQNAWQAVQVFGTLFPEHLPATIIEQINTFPGTDRRFEKLAEGVYTDYAHHPTEIRAMLQLARELNDNVVVVYQPHQNIRQHDIIDDYKDCFVLASHVYWLPTYQSREDPRLRIIPPQDLIAQLDNPAIAEPADMNNDLVRNVRAAVDNGALVVCVGAGSIDEWAREHLVT